ncbi:39S ribosomal protein L52, mitochondrial-like isoform X2 [Macrosteles quadrilineatus]|uniref:39S ribosomal protein L52, mitochondrial-like isoform X2 n=1 Tax=Macrosteles quadrilineatus TaxID=74068 RepID=UPI0023E308BE|nr:39S ribosomal protein L52, mitochondrial-like isoform X2 [Macrosteles quadrilineatus]
MSLVFLLKSKTLLPNREIFQISRAYLNKWRKARNQRYMMEPRRRNSVIFDNPNANRMLRDGPDYKFMDGRPTPYMASQYKRICQNREHTATIIQYNQEIDLALQLEKMKEKEHEDKVQSILDRKLKPKGDSIRVKQDSVK